MKIILAGCTGFIGGEVLAQCRRKASITSIVVLTRSELPEELTDDPKVVPVVVNDFLEYSDEVKDKLLGASAAIWALRAASYKVELEYPLAFANAMRPLAEKNRSFSYMHVSGVLAEKDQVKPLWFLQEGRRAKGLAEIRLREFAHDKTSTNPWETYIARPSMVTPKVPGVLDSFGGWALGAIRVDQLAAAMIDVVERGAGQETFENADLVAHAKEIMTAND
ncbi:hypothetical protein LTR70_002217 [Exophiala xenobiotica]|uniref:NAD(P)-binding domain-containing protein n=1 Tax=Lithohypha guttulata TaxID=1690604 RepID=A0ABR0JYQ5_9EURO|nr:hypothetical protein LTR24_008870 [Lithohypha guttulata]KAK5096981.1 hypothetical protein LTR24_002422 [Lithohypha guttulata]KAK5326217.1 hypothetical protein LTR70_002217 [Exophiala xenobiotica]